MEGQGGRARARQEKRRNLILEIPPISKSQVASMKKGDCDGGIEVVAGPLSTPTIRDSGCAVKLFFSEKCTPFPNPLASSAPSRDNDADAPLETGNWMFSH
jgi:hypothetical protein